LEKKLKEVSLPKLRLFPTHLQVDGTGARHRLASVEPQGSEFLGTVHSLGRVPPYEVDSRGRLVIAKVQVGDGRDYVCVVKAGAAGTSEATSSVRVFGKCPQNHPEEPGDQRRGS
jgi:hypothetical protein